MTLVVIYDPTKELAALVEPDGPWGEVPLMVGPDAAELLEQFVTDLPFDYAALSLSARAAVWTQYVKDKTGRTPEELLSGAQPAPPPAGDGATPASDPAATTPPEAAPAAPGGAPADTDPTAGGSPPATGTDTAGGTTPATKPAGTTTPASETDGPPASTPDSATDTPPASTTTKQCPVCSGSGSVKSEPDGAIGQCGYCNGSGTVEMPA